MAAVEWRERRASHYTYHKRIHDRFVDGVRKSGCLYVHHNEPTKWMLSTYYMGQRGAVCIADQEEPPLEYAAAMYALLTGGE